MLSTYLTHAQLIFISDFAQLIKEHGTPAQIIYSTYIFYGNASDKEFKTLFFNFVRKIIMWLQSIAMVSLTVCLSSVCEGAEYKLVSANQLSKSSIAPSNPQASTTNSTIKPITLYQQALDHLLGRNGANKSAEKAAELFQTLAEQNWSSAQHMLGNMYYSGKGVEKNDLLAYKWLSLASKNNIQLAEAIHEKRKLLHTKLSANLSGRSLDKVEMWITEWKPEQNKNLQLN